MSFAEYAEYDGLGLADLVRKGEVTPAELVEAAIERIERHNGVLNAVVYKAYDEARAAAGATLPDGPFRGVPFLIKDLGVTVAGWPRTSGSRFTKDDGRRAPTAASSRRYRQSGAGLRRQDQHARVRHHRHDRVGAARAPAAIRGTRITSPAARPAARPARWRPAWSRWPTPATAWARSASRPPAAAWWA